MFLCENGGKASRLNRGQISRALLREIDKAGRSARELLPSIWATRLFRCDPISKTADMVSSRLSASRNNQHRRFPT